jgi:HK97 family phage portal protein
MKLVAAIRHWLAQPAEVKSAAISPSAAAWLRGEVPAGAAMLINAYQQSSWVYAAVSAKAAKLAQAPFKLYAGERELTEGAAVDLFRRPHPHLDRFAFWELVATWLDLRGEAFILALDATGAVLPLRPQSAIRSLLVLNPDHFSEIIEDHGLAGWRYTGAGASGPMGSALLLPEEVIHLRLPNPFNFWRGMSPLGVAMVAAQADYFSGQFMKGLILNNADTGLIVTSEHHLTQAQIDQVQAALRERKSRAGMADRPLFLSGGVKVEKPALNAADLEFLEHRKFTRQEILAIFRVPDTVLGFTEDANRAVAESQMLHWIHNVIAPLCRRLEAGLQPVLSALAAREAATGFFDLDELPEMQNARRNRVDAALKLFQLGVPLNDINRGLDLGLPDYPWGSAGYLPGGLVPASTGQHLADFAHGQGCR